MIWSSPDDLLRILILAPLAYLALVLLLRLTGKRMLSKMNAFDLVVTIALGSTLATVILSKQTSLAEGVLALLLLIGLQYVIAWGSTRSRRFNHLVQSEPSLVFYQGELLREALRKENVSPGAVYSGMRASGFASVDQVEAVVLEADGSLTVVGRSSGETDLLQGVRRATSDRTS